MPKYVVVRKAGAERFAYLCRLDETDDGPTYRVVAEGTMLDMQATLKDMAV